ncbi:hypothetical protein ABZ619_32470 [Streptomyces sp. NPDC007851]|uniref:hypothetical protein n=1 Tax=Streptomyces sp. NPDC007851 TaxID=3155008 RepID=UPI0033DE74B2
MARTGPTAKGAAGDAEDVSAGAGVNSSRPQRTGSQAANHTAQKYPAGADGWDPFG